MTRRATIPETFLAETPFDLTDLKVDTLLLSQQRLARKIAQDLSQGLGVIPGEAGVFEAKWRSQRPLVEVAQRHLNE